MDDILTCSTGSYRARHPESCSDRKGCGGNGRFGARNLHDIRDTLVEPETPHRTS